MKSLVSVTSDFVTVKIGIVKCLNIIFTDVFFDRPFSFAEFFAGFEFARNGLINTEKQEICIKHHECDVG